MASKAIAAASLAVLTGTLVYEIGRGRARRFDFALESALRRRGPRRARAAEAFVEKPEVVLAQSAAAAVIAVPRHPRVALCIIAAPLFALGVCSALKIAINRPRPIAHLFQRKGLQSFPSSHTAGKTALVWMLATALPARPRKRFGLALLAAVDVVGIALARIADGAHWPSDTLGGAAIGVAAAEAVGALGGCPRRD